LTAPSIRGKLTENKVGLDGPVLSKAAAVSYDIPINTFEFEIKGKPYWRVVAGPANTLQSKRNMLTKIQSAGFTDAYFVKN